MSGGITGSVGAFMSRRSVRSGLWIGATLLSVVVLSGCGDSDAPEEAEIIRPVRVVEISDASSLAQRWFPGRAKATREVTLAFSVSGTLVSRRVDVGDETEAGDVIAHLDPAPFQREVERLSAERNKAKAKLKNASAQARRQQKLFEDGWVAEARLDTFVAEEQSAKADVGAVTAALERAKLDLGYTNLDAPFAGRIVATYAENFEEVNAKQPIVRLLDTSRIEMIVDIPENLISFAPHLQNVSVSYDPFPDLEIPAQVKEIGTEANETTRTYPVTLIMDQPQNARILPGMAGKATGQAVLPGDAPAAQITIPVSAIFTPSDGDTDFVWVVDREIMTVSRRAVVLGTPTAQGLVVSEGLSSGDLVVSAGVHSLKEGQKVKLIDQGQS
jgi:RND family efflux transporter MFP subunit